MSARKIKRGFRSIITPLRRPRELSAPGARSSLRTAKNMNEIKGLRSIPRRGQDDWEQAVEAKRIDLARERRLFWRNPQRGERVES